MFLCAIFDTAFNFNSRFSRFVHEVKCDRSWLVAYSILSVVYDCTPFVKRLNEVAVSFIISLRSAIFVPWIITLWQEDTGNIFQLLRFSQVPHALLTRFRHNPRFSKVRRRCGRGRHGRPWPCEGRWKRHWNWKPVRIEYLNSILHFSHFGWIIDSRRVVSTDRADICPTSCFYRTISCLFSQDLTWR